MTRRPPIPGNRLGIPDRASWDRYSRKDVEAHAREVHVEVLRESGFDRDRACEIADQSADSQARQLDTMRESAAGAAPTSLLSPRAPGRPPDWSALVPSRVLGGDS
ncbi:MAG TPA: hypothetical protein VD931_09555 [Baekduia sp.]|nr:hypothetical protein [Baekduia sp.]